METEPNEENSYHLAHVLRLLASYHHWTSKHLIAPDLTPLEQARQLFRAPFAVLSHNTAVEPILNYGNLVALQLFELAWDELIVLPSRRSAEPIHQDDRARLLATVSRQGYIDDYRGVRISKNGKRFMIEQATVWNLLDEHGTPYGQAATFSAWRYMD